MLFIISFSYLSAWVFFGQVPPSASGMTSLQNGNSISSDVIDIINFNASYPLTFNQYLNVQWDIAWDNYNHVDNYRYYQMKLPFLDVCFITYGTITGGTILTPVIVQIGYTTDSLFLYNENGSNPIDGLIGHYNTIDQGVVVWSYGPASFDNTKLKQDSYTRIKENYGSYIGKFKDAGYINSTTYDELTSSTRGFNGLQLISNMISFKFQDSYGKYVIPEQVRTGLTLFMLPLYGVLIISFLPLIALLIEAVSTGSTVAIIVKLVAFSGILIALYMYLT